MVNAWNTGLRRVTGNQGSWEVTKARDPCVDTGVQQAVFWVRRHTTVRTNNMRCELPWKKTGHVIKSQIMTIDYKLEIFNISTRVSDKIVARVIISKIMKNRRKEFSTRGLNAVKAVLV